MKKAVTEHAATGPWLPDFIGGRFVTSGRATFENRNPATGELINLVSEADASAVGDAVDSEEEAVVAANDSPYGLATSIWTENLTRAHSVAAQIDVGITWVNSWFLRDLRTPFGGSRQSGIGREGGVHSMEFYTELRNICIKL
jgi:acyl-CoA reductase-like NAD-dependent aldehyde dehydrogenase